MLFIGNMILVTETRRQANDKLGLCGKGLDSNG